MSKKVKKLDKGITLISLVVTIVVLLILAGVTIVTLTGENGILKRASNAAEETQKQTATEKMNFKITNIQINTYAKEQRMPTLQEIADEFYEDDEIEYVITKEEVASKEKIDVTGYNSIFTKLSEYPYEFEIDSSLRLASINGVKIADNSSDNTELLGKISDLESTIGNMQNQINSLNTEISTLNSEITTLKSTDKTLGESISSINSSNTLTWTQLHNCSSTSSTTSRTLMNRQKFSNFKYIVLVIGGSNNSFYSGFISVEKFKKEHTTHGVAFSVGSNSVYAKYIDDQHCYLWGTNDTFGCNIYGVK